MWRSGVVLLALVGLIAALQDVAGSPYYVAPEVLDKNYERTGAIWKAADMWSIGVIVYLLVHG